MAALIKKPLLKGKKNPLGGKKKSIDEMILDARMQLEKAKIKNRNVIDAEIRNVRYGRNHHVNQTQEARSFAKIKNAYYALNVIDKAKIRLNDIETSQELYSAMNDISNALKTINQIYRKSEKPKTGKFVKESDKLDRVMEKEGDLMENMYHKIDNIDDLVSNEVVEKIINGESMDDCLRYEEGIMISVEELPEINLDEIQITGEGGASTEDTGSNVDFSDIDFSDFS